LLLEPLRDGGLLWKDVDAVDLERGGVQVKRLHVLTLGGSVGKLSLRWLPAGQRPHRTSAEGCGGTRSLGPLRSPGVHHHGDE
jgi:hypothetical protein